MKLAEGIRKHGFRKWYERELLQGHAHMALSFLCLIGLFAAYEGLSRHEPLTRQLGSVATMLVFFGVGLYAVRRYLQLLSHAESAAHQADCPACQTYGRMTLLQSDPSGEQVQVRCKHCGHEWHITS